MGVYISGFIFFGETNMSRKYTLNENYFDKIDTEEKAYFLGLLYADGCNRDKRTCIKIGLQECDKEILEKFSIAIESNKPIAFFRRDQIPNRQNESIVELSSKHLSQRLIELGCVPRKSLILKFPTEEQVPYNLVRHFIRGYFDGDGCVSIFSKKNRPSKSVCCNIISTEEFCIKMKSIIDKETNIDSHIRYKSKNNITKSLSIGGNQQVLIFLEWLYKNSTIYLKRKYEKYQEFLELRKSFRGYNKKSNYVENL